MRSNEMPTLLEALLGSGNKTVEELRPATGNDAKRAEQAYGAAVGAILRGVEKKAQTQQGAESIWDMLRKQVEAGNVPAEAPAPSSGVQVRDLDPNTTNDILEKIFGKDAPQVEGSIGKVVTLDSDATKKLLGKVLPAVLGAMFGAAEKEPEESPRALPKILGGARTEMEQRQPKSSGVLEAILDKDHDGDVDLNDLIGIFAGK
jgi:hypothetical protein